MLGLAPNGWTSRVACKLNTEQNLFFREVFDSILREVRSNLGLKSCSDAENAANFTDFVDKLTDILSSTATKPATRKCVIALSNAEILRSLDQLLLPGNDLGLAR